MAGQLFRQQALAQQEERLWGGCMALRPVGLSVLTWLFLVLALTGGGFLAAGSYQRKAVVPGVLVTDKGTLQVRAPVAGMVEEVAAGTGGRVGQGDFLLRLRAGITQLDGEDVTGRLLAENRRQENLLRKLLRDREAEFPIRLARLAAERSGIAARQQRLETLVASEEAVYALMETQYARLDRLHASALVPASELERARMDLLKQGAVLDQARMERVQAGQALAQNARDEELLALEQSRGLGELRRSLSELHKQDLQLRAEQAVEIIAPVSGTIAVQVATTGDSVARGQVLMSLEPRDSRLEAELHVPSRAAGFLREGLPVNLRLDAFPYQKFGMPAATVREITGTPIAPAAGSEGRAAEPYYRVTATLARQQLHAFGVDHPLRPGMRFQADIVLEHRSLLEWLLEPLFIRGRLAGTRE